jgi:putative addiction module CopG family antidote
MGILSVSLTPELEKFIEDEVASGEFESKGQLIKKALKRFEEDLIVEDLLRISAEIEEGIYLEGDLDELAKKVK